MATTPLLSTGLSLCEPADTNDGSLEERAASILCLKSCLSLFLLSKPTEAVVEALLLEERREKILPNFRQKLRSELLLRVVVPTLVLMLLLDALFAQAAGAGEAAEVDKDGCCPPGSRFCLSS